jgi:hypothetical protein
MGHIFLDLQDRHLFVEHQPREVIPFVSAESTLCLEIKGKKKGVKESQTI